jgi:hypothetical protein
VATTAGYELREEMTALTITELKSNSPIPKGIKGAKSPEKMSAPNDTALVTVSRPIIAPAMLFEIIELVADLDSAIEITLFKK